MLHFRSTLFFWFTMLAVIAVNGQQQQQYVFRHVDQSDGLLHNDVLAISQDARGFIWVMTPNGLQRYDGSRFVNYPPVMNSAASGQINNAEMYADNKRGLIWVSDYSSVGKVETDANRFTAFTNDSLFSSSLNGFVAFDLPRGEQYLLRDNILLWANGKKSKPVLSRFNFFPPGTHEGSFITTDPVSGLTWVVISTDKIYVFDRQKRLLHTEDDAQAFHPLLDKKSFPANRDGFRMIMIDSRQNIWLSTWGDQLYRYDAASGVVVTYSLRALSGGATSQPLDILIPLVNCLVEDDHHNVWIGTENRGLIRYDPKNNSFRNYKAGSTQGGGLDYNYKIFSVCQDREQNLWVGTDKGISIFNPYRQNFSNLRHEPGNPGSINKGEILASLQTSGGDLLLGTWGGGIGIYNSGGSFRENLRFKGPDELNFVWSLCETKPDELWIGCQRGFLIRYNLRTRKQEINRPDELEHSTIRWIERDNAGDIWFGLQNGHIAKYDAGENRFVRSGYPDGEAPRGHVLNMLIGHDKRFWVSTYAGFKEFDPASMKFIHEWKATDGIGSAATISGNNCQGIEEYNDSMLLVGTIYGGLNLFNKRTLRFKRLGTADGLPSNTINAIRNGKNGFVWITTDYGLYQYHPISHKLIRYRLDEGLLTSSFNSPRFQPLANGRWLTFSIAEALSFDPGQLSEEEQLPRTEITGFSVYDKPLAIDSLMHTGGVVRLDYTQNFINIEFAALNFSSLQEHSFEYRLKGVDQHWVNGRDARFASYTGLQPGDYVFEVRSVSGTGTGELSALQIIISPPFWLTWWFISACVVMVLAVGYALLRGRERNIRAMEEEKRKSQEARIEMYTMNAQLSKAKLEALRSQMNPHFIFNCINSIDALIQSNDRYHATVFLNKFAKLIRNVLDSSKQDVVLLSRDLDTLRLYVELEQLRHENKFTAEIHADESLLMDDFKVPPLIVQPFVENAILHGLRYRSDNAGRLQVSVTREGDLLSFLIEDNGVGRHAVRNPAQKENVSYGIDMSNERVRLFNGENNASVHITDLYEKGQPSGTRVQVYLKVH